MSLSFSLSIWPINDVSLLEDEDLEFATESIIILCAANPGL